MVSTTDSEPATPQVTSDQTALRTEIAAEDEPISINGSDQFQLTATDLPPAVYRTVMFSFAWVIFAAWFAFGKPGRPDFVVFISGLIFTMLLAIPTILHAANPAHPHPAYRNLREFLSSPVETATGTRTGREVWIQIATIPVVLALGATAFGLVHLLES